MSQNNRLFSSCTFWLILKRIKQSFNVFVSKMAFKYANFVWKMGFVQFVFFHHYITSDSSGADTFLSRQWYSLGFYQSWEPWSRGRAADSQPDGGRFKSWRGRGRWQSWIGKECKSGEVPFCFSEIDFSYILVFIKI